MNWSKNNGLLARKDARLFYCDRKTKTEQFDITFDNLVGANESLSVSIQQAKAAILYPPKGLHTIVLVKQGQGNRYLPNVCIVLQSALKVFRMTHRLFPLTVPTMLRIHNYYSLIYLV